MAWKESLSQRDEGVNSLDQVYGEVSKRSPPGRTNGGRTFCRSFLGSLSRSTRLAARTRSNMPSGVRCRASPARKQTRLPTDGGTRRARAGSDRAPSVFNRKWMKPRWERVWAVRMKDFEKSTPTTSGTVRASSKEARPTAHPRSRAR